jgi:UDP-glucose 4-epimerase
VSESGTILVTGAARRLGAAVLRDLASTGERIVGVDLAEPEPEDRVEGVETVQADLRTPAIAALIARVRPDTVLHLDVLAGASQAGSRAAMKERNVIGTMQLLAACQQSSSVRRLVVKSSGAVYGCAPRDPAMFTEQTKPHLPPRSGYGKDVTEVEAYVRGFARRRPDVDITVLRFAGFLGPEVGTSYAEFFRLPVLPCVLGFDPRLQFVHIDDVVRAVRAAAGPTLPGTYNIAGAGTLTLSQIARRLGRPVLPVPRFATGSLGRLLLRFGVADFAADQVALLTYGRVLDTELMTTRLGLSLKYSTASALTAHAESTSLHPLLPTAALAAAESRLADLLNRRAAGREGDGL